MTSWNVRRRDVKRNTGRRCHERHSVHVILAESGLPPKSPPPTPRSFDRQYCLWGCRVWVAISTPQILMLNYYDRPRLRGKLGFGFEEMCSLLASDGERLLSVAEHLVVPMMKRKWHEIWQLKKTQHACTSRMRFMALFCLSNHILCRQLNQYLISITITLTHLNFFIITIGLQKDM